MKKNILIISIIILCFCIVYFSYFRYLKQLGAYDFHSKGNSFYELSQTQAESEMTYLTQAQEMYKQALEIWENEESQYNYDYVSDLLKEKQEQLKKQEEEEKQKKNETEQSSEELGESGDESDESQDGSSDGGKGNSNGEKGGENQQENTSSGSSDTDKTHGSSRGEEYNLGASQTIESLSQQEAQELEKVIEQLKQEQIYNQRYFGKKPQENNFNSLFDSFFGNVDRGGTKDW